MNTTQLSLEDNTSTQCSTSHKRSKRTKMENQSCQDSEVTCRTKQSLSTRPVETTQTSILPWSPCSSQTTTICNNYREPNDLLATVLRNGSTQQTVRYGSTILTVTCAVSLEDRISMWLSKALRDLTELSRYYSPTLTIRHSAKPSRRPETHTIILLAISDHNEYDHSPPLLSTFQGTPGYFWVPDQSHWVLYATKYSPIPSLTKDPSLTLDATMKSWEMEIPHQKKESIVIMILGLLQKSLDWDPSIGRPFQLQIDKYLNSVRDPLINPIHVRMHPQILTCLAHPLGNYQPIEPVT